VKLRDALALAALVIVAVAYTIGIVWQRAQGNDAIPNYDTYALYYPNLLYALDSLRLGEGLFWNRFQNCGQPFFAIAATGILYPPHAIYLFFEPHTGLFVLTALHLALAGVFAYALFRQIGLDVPAALAGGLAFQLGGITLFLAFWSPTLVGHYIWMPAAMAACERILRKPSARAAVLLGVVLGLQFLAGYPPITFFTYQLIGLRLLWEILAGERSALVPKLLAVALGLALPIGLIAVQLFPSLELASESLRNRPLTPAEIRPAALSVTWEKFRHSLGRGTGYGSIATIVPFTLALVGLTVRSTRRQAIFYLIIAFCYAALAFENPLSAVYQQLPLGKTFRMPQRFLWLSAFAVAALTALGAQAATALAPRRRTRILVVLIASLSGVALMGLVPRAALEGREWALAAAAVGVSTAAAWSAGANVLARAALPVLVLGSQLIVATQQFYGYLPDDSPLYAFRPAFARLREQLTAQDRIFQYSTPRHYGLQRKSPSIFRLPSITDYESQTSQRYTELYVRMIRDEPMQSVNDFYYQVSELPKNRPLFDLLATRYALVEVKGFFLWPRQLRDLEFVRMVGGGARMFRNPRSLPRAFFVPRAEVVVDPAALLERLASRSHDPRSVALIEAPPPDGDLGAAGPTGNVTIVADHAEVLTLRVNANGRGFLVVSDQLYPGWEATVNDAPAPIMKANYAFRLVRVPAGTSNVVFRYRPLSLRLGIWVSTATAVVVVVLLAIGLTRRSSPLAD
jgi:Bacterial membrane protein YfhO